MEPILAEPPEKPSTNNVPPTIVPTNNAAIQPPPNHMPAPVQPTEEKSRVQTTSTSHDGLRSILTTIGILILAPIIAFALTAFVFQSYQVDGSSMETTLQNQDRLIVLKLPRTWSKITGHAYIPNRGDVIIFNKENLYEFDGSGQKKQLVKRVIGLPGDRVVVKEGKVLVYNADHPQGFDPDTTLPYGTVIKTTSGVIDQTVGARQVFVMGDNRGNSLDSRIFGPIADKDIVGKLTLRIFPFNKLKGF